MIDDKIKDINKLNFNVSINDCFSELKPHPKFESCTFDSYNHDENYPSQLQLKNILKDISETYDKLQNQKRKLFFRKPKRTKLYDNIYIDGAYGIGKTHLLSACFNYFKGKKAFLSFLELTYFMNYHGLEKSIELFIDTDLLLIDEFDLDDPATTRMAARFIDSINKHTTVVTTSNRLPKELGGGKFDTEQFARELGLIANTFKNITVEGKSFRLKLQEWRSSYSDNTFSDTFNTYLNIRGKLMTEKANLSSILSSHHPFRFFVIPKNADAVFIDNFETFADLNEALRFAIFIDHCYYYDTRLFIKSKGDDIIFPKSLIETSFERQFLRCMSRLGEIAVFFNK